MGYSLTIGEAVMEAIPGDEWGDGYLHISVEEVTHDEAPAFGEPTDHRNTRWPSYSSWSQFAEFTGLEDVLLDPESNDNIRGGHPGHFLLTQAFKDDVDIAMERFMKMYPDAIASYDNYEERPYDGELCRLTWLKYWVDWALENCQIPIFANT